LICPCCKSEVTENSIKRFNIYKLFLCKNCNVEFWNPRDIDSSFYENENISESKNLHSDKPIYRVNTWHQVFFDTFGLENIQPNFKVLDLGCTNGALISYMKSQRDAQYFGVDFDKKSTQVAKEYFKLENIYNMDFYKFFEFCRENNIKFDLIMAFEIIEHVPDTKKFILDINNSLTENGVFVGSVPNRDRLFASLNRAVEEFDWPPHHLTWFDRVSLKNLLDSSGFKSETFKPVVKGFKEFIPLIEHSLVGKYTIKYKQKINNSIDNNQNLSLVATKPTIKSRVLKIVRFIIFSPFLILYPSYLGKGDSIYFQVKK
jgi:SAM-dependent methyltransferase